MLKYFAVTNILDKMINKKKKLKFDDTLLEWKAKRIYHLVYYLQLAIQRNNSLASNINYRLFFYFEKFNIKIFFLFFF